MFTCSHALLILVSCLGTLFACNQTCFEEMKKSRLEMLKMNLLSSLNMQAPPDISGVEIPPHIERMAMEMAESEPEEETESVILLGEDPSDGTEATTLIAQFNPSDKYLSRQVKRGMLGVYLQLEAEYEDPLEIEVIAKERLQDGSFGEILAQKSVYITKSMMLRLKIDGDKIMSMWNNEDLKGITVLAMYGKSNLAVHPQNATNNKDTRMFLTVETVVGGRRKKRHAPVCKREQGHKHCCLYEMIVDFKALGFDFVLAPRRYNAYICRGECRTINHHLQMANMQHSRLTMIQEIHHNRPLSSCCHPTAYDPVKLIYMNGDKQIVISEVQGMIARDCSCS